MRFGLLDIAAMGTVLFAVLMPTPSRDVKPLYTYDRARLVPLIADAQARVAAQPEDGRAVARLSDLLVRARQTDWAARVAALGAQEAGPERWRAFLAVSTTHADRFEIGDAYVWARRALDECVGPKSECPEPDRIRLQLYVNALKAGVDSGADPRENPTAFHDAVRRVAPTIKLGGP